MANPHRAQVEIELGGKTRVLRYDLNALAELERVFGKKISEIFREENMGMWFIREMVWAGLRWSSSKLTPSAVGAMMELDKLKYYGEKIGEALNLVMPKKDGNGVDAEAEDGPFVSQEDETSTGLS